MNIKKPSLVDSVTNSTNLIKKAQVCNLCHVCYKQFLWNCSETIFATLLEIIHQFDPNWDGLETLIME